MIDFDWAELRAAYDILRANPSMKKLEGIHWTIYKIGIHFRIDIKG